MSLVVLRALLGHGLILTTYGVEHPLFESWLLPRRHVVRNAKAVRIYDFGVKRLAPA